MRLPKGIPHSTGGRIWAGVLIAALSKEARIDPNACWLELSEAFGEDWDRAEELADALLDWMERGGFPPQITGRTELDRLIAKQTCQAIQAWDIA
jgi:hypothetical protein